MMTQRSKWWTSSGLFSDLECNFLANEVTHGNIHNPLIFQAHCILFGGWRWAKESKSTDAMQACSRKRQFMIIHKTLYQLSFIFCFDILDSWFIKLFYQKRAEESSKDWTDEKGSHITDTCQLENQKAIEARMMIVSLEFEEMH